MKPLTAPPWKEMLGGLHQEKRNHLLGYSTDVFCIEINLIKESIRIFYMNIKKTSSKVFICILLCSLALLSNLFRVELFFNISFLMGSFFVMLAVMLLGMPYGVIAGFVAGTGTYLVWNHPWMIPVATCEALVVANLYYKRNGNPVIYDIAYWVCIMPMVYFCYHFVRGIELQETLLIILKQSVNGIFNTLLAVLAFMSLRLLKRFQGERTEYFQIVFVVMVSLVLIPSMLIVVTGARAYHEREEESLESRISNISETTRNSLENWIKEHLKEVQTLAALVGDPNTNSPLVMQSYVETIKAASPAFRKMGVFDNDSVTVAYSPL
jgi:hypothetical protein